MSSGWDHPGDVPGDMLGQREDTATADWGTGPEKNYTASPLVVGDDAVR